MRFLLYAGNGLIDANIPTLAALRERLRLELAGQPSAMSDLYVLVFAAGDGRYLGRRNVLVEDGHPVLVLPSCRPRAAKLSSGWNTRGTDARFVAS